MKKIGLILILIIILPIAFLLINEFGKLNENEQVLEQIYNDPVTNKDVINGGVKFGSQA